MTQLANDILQAANAIDPNAPAVQIAEAAINTVANPSAENILADAELAINLVKQLKTALSGTHPSVSKLVKSLIKELI